MAGLFSKIFGKKEGASEQTPPSPASEAERKLAEIRNTVMDLESKDRAINSDRSRLRAEIRQKEQDYQKLMDEYESLPDGLEKEMLMGDLEKCETELDEFRKRVETLNNAVRDNSTLIQTMKRARERLQAAISAGKSPMELASLLEEIAQEASDADIGLDILKNASDKLGGATSDYATSESRDKVLARLAARKGAKASPAPQAQSDAPARPAEETEHPQRPMPASQF